MKVGDTIIVVNFGYKMYIQKSSGIDLKNIIGNNPIISETSNGIFFDCAPELVGKVDIITSIKNSKYYITQSFTGTKENITYAATCV